MKLSLMLSIIFEMACSKITINLPPDFQRSVPRPARLFQPSQQHYNICLWTQHLHLQQCTLVGIGLKHFALFIEDRVRTRKNFFLGVCQYETLMTWTFCTNELAQQHPSKCTFNLNPYEYHVRVHRRFCDMAIMRRNPRCTCAKTIFGEEMFRVTGFPTCAIQPIPEVLCETYNVCGLNPCIVEKYGTVYSVQCLPTSKSHLPFCEYSTHEDTAHPVQVYSEWTEWKPLDKTESLDGAYKMSSCLTREGLGAVDCLGPGTACCFPDYDNCKCTTSIESGTMNLYKYGRRSFCRARVKNRYDYTAFEGDSCLDDDGDDFEEFYSRGNRSDEDMVLDYLSAAEGRNFSQIYDELFHSFSPSIRYNKYILYLLILIHI